MSTELKISDIEILISNELIPYQNIFQKFNEYISNKKEFLWCLEHQDVYTLGNSCESFNSKLIENIPVVKSNRGGLMTFHGEGQIVLYFCINLTNFFKKINKEVDISYIVSLIEKIGIESLKKIGIESFSHAENGRGIWIRNNDKSISKIGFIGIRISNGYLTHGISINYNNNLTPFDFINPCGLNCKITSASQVLKNNLPDKLEFKKILIQNALNFLNAV